MLISNITNSLSAQSKMVPSSYKCSAVAEMGEHNGHKRYGPKKEGLCPLLGGGAGSPSNTTWSGPRPTSVPSGILIHPAIWPQQTWAENWGRVCAPFSGEGSWAYLCANCHLDPSSRLATINTDQKLGDCALFLGRSWVPI